MKMRAVALPLLVLYPLYAGMMYAKQEAILFPAASEARHPLHTAPPANGQLVELHASFGTVRAVYLGADNNAPRGPAILYLHGNFECIEDSFALLQPLARAGSPVLQLEFPGYCGADGKPDFAQVTQAADLAFDWLAARARDEKRKVAVMGYSIGGGAAADLTRRRKPDALLLLSTYTSMEALAHRYVLPGFLARYPWDTHARVHAFGGPIFLEHGRRDKVIPYAMGQQLAQAAPQAEFASLDCGHDDCHFDQALFATRIPAWLAAHGLTERSNNMASENLHALIDRPSER